MRNPTSDLQIPCFDALPLSHKDKKINLWQVLTLQLPEKLNMKLIPTKSTHYPKTGNKNTQINQVKFLS